jgi:hypothetical protein
MPDNLGQAKVDDGDIERHLAAEKQAFLAIGGGIDSKAVALQAGRQGLAQRALRLQPACRGRRTARARTALRRAHVRGVMP